jgi:hypothetical protein
MADHLSSRTPTGAERLRADQGDGRHSVPRHGPQACPRCRSRYVVPIIYGLPAEKGRAAASRGEVQLGGCCITGDDPDRHCRCCGHQWRRGGQGEPNIMDSDSESVAKRAERYARCTMNSDSPKHEQTCCTQLFFAQVVKREVILECCSCGRLWRCLPDGTREAVQDTRGLETDARRPFKGRKLREPPI